MALSAVAGLKPLAGFHEAPSNNFNSFFSLPWAPVSIAVLLVGCCLDCFYIACRSRIRLDTSRIVPGRFLEIQEIFMRRIGLFISAILLATVWNRLRATDSG